MEQIVSAWLMGDMGESMATVALLIFLAGKLTDYLILKEKNRRAEKDQENG